jgi:drug/metabolite transporter (DMT)-like permease
MNRVKGFSLLLLTGVIYGTFGIFVRLLGEDLSAFQQLFYNCLFAVILILILKAVGVYRLTFSKLRKKDFIFYGVLYGINAILFTLAVLNAQISAVIFALYTGSFLASFVISSFFFKEKVTLKKLIGLVLAILGLIIFTYPLSLKSITLGFVLGLLTGVDDALCNSSSKYFEGKIPTTTLVFARQVGICFFGLIPILFLKQSIFPTLTVSSSLLLLLYGLLGLLASFTIIVGFQNFDLNLGTIVISSEIVTATVLALFLFQEVPSSNQMWGGVCIIGAIIVTNFAIPRTRKKSKFGSR